MIDNYLTNYGGSRFILSVLTLIFTSVLTWYGKTSSEVYSIVIISTIGAFIAGHTIQNVKSITSSNVTPEEEKEIKRG